MEKMTLTLEQIKAIRDGCKGVIAGKYEQMGEGGLRVVGAKYKTVASCLRIRDASHIARLDPATVHELCELAEKSCANKLSAQHSASWATAAIYEMETLKKTIKHKEEAIALLQQQLDTATQSAGKVEGEDARLCE